MRFDITQIKVSLQSLTTGRTRYQLARTATVILFSTVLFSSHTIPLSYKLPHLPSTSSLLSVLVGQLSLAQVPSSIGLVQQGNQIVVNGRSLPIPWSQKQQQIGITDVGLVQAIGLELLDTSDVQRQPIQWFSPAPLVPDASSHFADSPVLQTWLTAQYRFLDISRLAQQWSWQLRVNGLNLQITTPRTKVLGLRQARQPWGDRIVVDLDRPTPWQVTATGDQFAVTLDAQAEATVSQNFRPTPGQRLTSLMVQADRDRTTLQIGVPAGLRPRVWTLPNPDRLVIDVRPDSWMARDILWAPGLRWRQQLVSVGSAQFPVVLLEVDPRQTQVKLRPILSDPSRIPGTMPLIEMSQRSQVAAAINAGFFNRNNQLPLGAIRRDSKWLSSPILNRGVIAWNDQGETLFNTLRLDDSLITTTGQRFPIFSSNSGYIGPGLSIYTPDWGPAYSPISDGEMILTIQQDQVVRQSSGRAAGQQSFPIPTDGYFLILRSYPEALNTLPVGTILQRQTATQPNIFERFPHILGGGPLLLRDRQIALNAAAEQFSPAFINQSAPRSAIGRLASGQLILVTAQNRIGGLGPTLQEIALIMQTLGAIDAVNLDGGSSTSLYLGGTLLNRPPQTAARVQNAIGIFIQPNSGLQMLQP
jgi:hypothetical protein